MSKDFIKGFSKLSKEEKLKMYTTYFADSKVVEKELKEYWHPDPIKQKLFEEFAENTISNYFLPYGIAPNFLIDGVSYMVPMVIEESSVIAAAGKSANIWYKKGGFHTELVSTVKIGQVHFVWEGDFEALNSKMPAIKRKLLKDTDSITTNMRRRGGGIIDIELKDMHHSFPGYKQIFAKFETIDSMGANFINSCLEEFAISLKEFIAADDDLKNNDCNIIMSILSNYTPECRIKCWVECGIDELTNMETDLSPIDFAEKFRKAVHIAGTDVYRATTHNKGIFNGIDAVALATGNDFRAIEACGHAWASRSGKYSSLTEVIIQNGVFRYQLDIAMAMGTVGGLTQLHPLVKRSLELLGNPNARELMKIAATAGLANNFGAVKTLITKGIQVGHMKMHLLNILNSLKANEIEKEKAVQYFKKYKVSYNAVADFLSLYREGKIKE